MRVEPASAPGNRQAWAGSAGATAETPVGPPSGGWPEALGRDPSAGVADHGAVAFSTGAVPAEPALPDVRAPGGAGRHAWAGERAAALRNDVPGTGKEGVLSPELLPVLLAMPWGLDPLAAAGWMLQPGLDRQPGAVLGAAAQRRAQSWRLRALMQRLQASPHAPRRSGPGSRRVAAGPPDGGASAHFSHHSRAASSAPNSSWASRCPGSGSTRSASAASACIWARDCAGA